ILEAWFPSYQGGTVIAETLFGDHNPGGKLTVTFPKSVGQIELNFPFKKGSHGKQYQAGPNGSGNTRVIGSLYPFGHGLSYTTFHYSNLRVDSPQKGTQGIVRIKVDIKNQGQRTGDEVVQLYIRDKVSSVVTYDSQLRGFKRITLSPGEVQTVQFDLTPTAFQLLDKNMNWTVEPGVFEVRIGSSSEDIRLRKEIELSE
ncbi:MAG: beta-glucosidase, partial [Bacteroides sp.]|nr:beta-glucosidase [Bacteroides sp.]